MVREFVFDDKHDLVKYVYSKLTTPTQIKVQKTLYLLFAFYGATYGQLNKEEDFNDQEYPEKLFDAKFQAWRYGPVEYDVYGKEKNGGYDQLTDVEFSTNLHGNEKNNVKIFVDSIINQTDVIDDFGLVDRTHQDNVWLDAYVEGERYISIDNDAIIEEYVDRYVK